MLSCFSRVVCGGEGHVRVVRGGEGHVRVVHGGEGQGSRKVIREKRVRGYGRSNCIPWCRLWHG